MKKQRRYGLLLSLVLAVVMTASLAIGIGTVKAQAASAPTALVVLNANGGSCSTSQLRVTYGSKYPSLPTPSRSGYQFSGWYTMVSGGSKVTTSTTVTTTATHTLHAHWVKMTPVTVAFNANGGTVSPTSQTKYYAQSYGSLPTPTRTGYTFTGWYTAVSGGSYVSSSTLVTTAGTHTLHAHWVARNYTITYNGNGGTPTASTKTVTYASTYGTLASASRTGYNFTGWYTAASGGSYVGSSTKVNTAGNHTLYAHWSPKVSTVTFNANGGSTPTPSKQVTYGSTYGTLPTPTRANYIFIGWFTGTTTGNIVSSTTNVTITSSQTLYARWTGKAYNVTFDANGGSTPTASKYVTYASTYGTLPTPTKTGYNFAGWYTAVSGGTNITSGTKVTITGSQKLYAHWNAKPYTLYFNANGGSTPTSSKTIYYDGAYGSMPTPTRANYTFSGWFTTATGGARVTNTTLLKSASNQTVYAHWTGVPVTVSFNANGGTVNPTSQKYTYGIKYGAFPTPTKTGYSFVCWMLNGNPVTKDTVVTTASAHTLVAKWNGVHCVTLNANGGHFRINPNSTHTISVNYKGMYGDKLYENVVYHDNANYQFDGWYTAATGGTRITPATTVTNTGNHTLYAHWVKRCDMTASNNYAKYTYKVSMDQYNSFVKNVSMLYFNPKYTGIYTVKCTDPGVTPTLKCHVKKSTDSEPEYTHYTVSPIKTEYIGGEYVWTYNIDYTTLPSSYTIYDRYASYSVYDYFFTFSSNSTNGFTLTAETEPQHNITLDYSESHVITGNYNGGTVRDVYMDRTTLIAFINAYNGKMDSQSVWSAVLPAVFDKTFEVVIDEAKGALSSDETDAFTELAKYSAKATVDAKLNNKSLGTAVSEQELDAIMSAYDSMLEKGMSPAQKVVKHVATDVFKVTFAGVAAAFNYKFGTGSKAELSAQTITNILNITGTSYGLPKTGIHFTICSPASVKQSCYYYVPQSNGKFAEAWSGTKTIKVHAGVQNYNHSMYYKDAMAWGYELNKIQTKSDVFTFLIP